MRHIRVIRLLVSSLLLGLSLGFVASGCGGGSESETAAKQEMPPAAKKMQELMEQKAAKKGAVLKTGPGGPPGRP